MGDALTRDQARAAWKASGMSCRDLSVTRLESLRQRINDCLRENRPIRGFCARGKAKLVIRPNDMSWAEIRCSAYYFTDRQAVTFEPTGFVGFAGWASDENVQPILRAFMAWLEELRPLPSPPRSSNGV